MSSEERMRRLGLSHLINAPEEVQRAALMELRDRLTRERNLREEIDHA